MKKILLINRLGIGDIVLTTPLARIIKENIPDAWIGFVTSNKAVDVLQNHPYIDEVFPYRSSLRNITKMIRQRGYQQAINIDSRLTSTLIAKLSGCELLNSGWTFSWRGKKYFPRVANHSKAILDFVMDCKYLNIDTGKISIQKPIIGNIDIDSKDKIADWLKLVSTQTRKLVLIAHHGVNKNKNWPPEYFGQLNHWLNKNGILPVYVGAPREQADIESISGEKINVAGIFSLREVAAIAKHADLCISVCTGTLHVFSSTDTPLLALYGPTPSERWAPMYAYVLNSHLPCIPCGKSTCTQDQFQQCMWELSPQTVIDSIIKNGWLA